MSEEKQGNFWFGFFLGGLFGAIAIFIMGTKEGKKLMERLTEDAEEYEEDLEQKVAKLQIKGEDFLNEANSVKEKITKEVKTGKKSITNAVADKMDQALTKIENIQKKGVELTRDVHHNYFKKNGKSLTN